MHFVKEKGTHSLAFLCFFWTINTASFTLLIWFVRKEFADSKETMDLDTIFVFIFSIAVINYLSNIKAYVTHIIEHY